MSKEVLISDDLHQSFGVVSYLKKTPCLQLDKYVKIKGDCIEQTDRSLGRIVYKINGAISARNSLTVENLSLSGPVFHIQLKTYPHKVATLHLDLKLSRNPVPFRITLSTLYSLPKFLGSSLRLPLPNRPGWMTIVIDMNEVLEKYSEKIDSKSLGLSFDKLKSFEICSNLLFRDIVSNSTKILDNSKSVKDLSIKLNGDPVEYIDIVHFIQNPSLYNIQQLAQSPRPTQEDVSESFLYSISDQYRKEKQIQNNIIDEKSINDNYNDSMIKEDEKKSNTTPKINSTPTLKKKASTSKTTTPKSNNTSPIRATPSRPNTSLRSKSTPSSPLRSTPSPSRTAFRTPKNLEKKDIIEESPANSVFSRSDLNTSEVKYRKKDPVTPNHPTLTSSTLSSSSSTTSSSTNGKLLTLDHQLNYKGGPAAIIYDGSMLVYATGPQVVLIDLISHTLKDNQTRPTNGFWKAFHYKYHNNPSLQQIKFNNRENDENNDENIDENVINPYPQAFLKGHTNNINQIKVSNDEKFLFTAETNVTNGLIIIWDLIIGARISSFRPYSFLFNDFSFNTSLTQLVTVGQDNQNRYQIIVWNLPQILVHRVGLFHSSSSSPSRMSSPLRSTSPSSPSAIGTSFSSSVKDVALLNSFIIAKQLSEFSIYSIQFSPYKDDELISCGEENIRLWRINKGILRGRPILLGEFSRGYKYLDIGFHANLEKISEISNQPLSNSLIKSSQNEHDRKKEQDKKEIYGQFFFITSTRGIILKINYQTEQIVCAYALHQNLTVINKIIIQNGYAITGASCEEFQHSNVSPNPSAVVPSSNQGIMNYHAHYCQLKNSLKCSCVGRLRLWTLDFVDFILESRHEGDVTFLTTSASAASPSASPSSQLLLVGTNASTLGLLNLNQHNYETILRSHIRRIISAIPIKKISPTIKFGGDFATVSEDNTVRVWNSISGVQIVEFASEFDRPLCLSYHPQYPQLLISGFISGNLRVLNCETALTVGELQLHNISSPLPTYHYHQPVNNLPPLTGILAIEVFNLDEKQKKLFSSSYFNDNSSLINSSSITTCVLTLGSDGMLVLSEWVVVPETFKSSLLPIASVRVLSINQIETIQQIMQKDHDQSNNANESLDVPIKVTMNLSPDKNLVVISFGVVETVSLYHLPTLAPAFQLIVTGNSTSSIKSVKNHSKSSSNLTSGLIFEEDEENEIVEENEKESDFDHFNTPQTPLHSASTTSPTKIFSLSPQVAYSLMKSPSTSTSSVSTTGSPASASSSIKKTSLQQGSPVVGLNFISSNNKNNFNSSKNDENDSDLFLLITTNRHFIAVPLSTRLISSSSSSSSSSFDLNLIKRIDFGVPTSVSYDNLTGNLFISLKNGVKQSSYIKSSSLTTSSQRLSNSSSSLRKEVGVCNPVVPPKNSFIILNLKIQVHVDEVNSLAINETSPKKMINSIKNTEKPSSISFKTLISTSTPQFYDNHGGSIIHLVPILHNHRLVVCDDVGGIYLYQIDKNLLTRQIIQQRLHQQQQDVIIKNLFKNIESTSFSSTKNDNTSKNLINYPHDDIDFESEEIINENNDNSKVIEREHEVENVYQDSLNASSFSPLPASTLFKNEEKGEIYDEYKHNEYNQQDDSIFNVSNEKISRIEHDEESFEVHEELKVEDKVVEVEEVEEDVNKSFDSLHFLLNDEKKNEIIEKEDIQSIYPLFTDEKTLADKVLESNNNLRNFLEKFSFSYDLKSTFSTIKANDDSNIELNKEKILAQHHDQLFKHQPLGLPLPSFIKTNTSSFLSSNSYSLYENFLIIYNLSHGGLILIDLTTFKMNFLLFPSDSPILKKENNTEDIDSSYIVTISPLKNQIFFIYYNKKKSLILLHNWNLTTSSSSLLLNESNSSDISKCTSSIPPSLTFTINLPEQFKEEENNNLTFFPSACWITSFNLILFFTSNDNTKRLYQKQQKEQQKIHFLNLSFVISNNSVDSTEIFLENCSFSNCKLNPSEILSISSLSSSSSSFSSSIISSNLFILATNMIAIVNPLSGKILWMSESPIKYISSTFLISSSITPGSSNNNSILSPHAIILVLQADGQLLVLDYCYSTNLIKNDSIKLSLPSAILTSVNANKEIILQISSLTPFQNKKLASASAGSSSFYNLSIVSQSKLRAFTLIINNLSTRSLKVSLNSSVPNSSLGLWSLPFNPLLVIPLYPSSTIVSSTSVSLPTPHYYLLISKSGSVGFFTTSKLPPIEKSFTELIYGPSNSFKENSPEQFHSIVYTDSSHNSLQLTWSKKLIQLIHLTSSLYIPLTVVNQWKDENSKEISSVHINEEIRLLVIGSSCGSLLILQLDTLKIIKHLTYDDLFSNQSKKVEKELINDKKKLCIEKLNEKYPIESIQVLIDLNTFQLINNPLTASSTLPLQHIYTNHTNYLNFYPMSSKHFKLNDEIKDNIKYYKYSNKIANENEDSNQNLSFSPLKNSAPSSFILGLTYDSSKNNFFYTSSSTSSTSFLFFVRNNSMDTIIELFIINKNTNKLIKKKNFLLRILSNPIESLELLTSNYFNKEMKNEEEIIFNQDNYQPIHIKDLYLTSYPIFDIKKNEKKENFNGDEEETDNMSGKFILNIIGQHTIESDKNMSIFLYQTIIDINEDIEEITSDKIDNQNAAELLLIFKRVLLCSNSNLLSFSSSLTSSSSYSSSILSKNKLNISYYKNNLILNNYEGVYILNLDKVFSFRQPLLKLKSFLNLSSSIFSNYLTFESFFIPYSLYCAYPIHSFVSITFYSTYHKKNKNILEEEEINHENDEVSMNENDNNPCDNKITHHFTLPTFNFIDNNSDDSSMNQNSSSFSPSTSFSPFSDEISRDSNGIPLTQHHLILTYVNKNNMLATTNLFLGNINLFDKNNN